MLLLLLFCLHSPVFIQAYRWHPWFGIGTAISALAGSLATTGVIAAEKNAFYLPVIDFTRECVFWLR